MRREKDSPDVVDRRPQIVGSVREGAVRPVLDAVAPVVRVVHAHARLVVLEVIAALRVSRGAVQIGTSDRRRERRA